MLNKDIYDVEKMIRTALAKGEFDKLLMGSPEYCYLPRWTSAPGRTDRPAIFDILYNRIVTHENRHDIVAAVTDAMIRVSKEFDGVVPMFSLMLYEFGRSYDGEEPLGLAFEPIVSRLERTLADNVDRLSELSDNGYSDMKSELKRLARNIVGVGGPDLESILTKK